MGALYLDAWCWPEYLYYSLTESDRLTIPTPSVCSMPYSPYILGLSKVVVVVYSYCMHSN